MRKIIFIVTFGIIAFACEDNMTTVSETVVTTSTVAGSWQVSKYIDDNDDETISFNNITFVIEPDGGFVVEKNGGEIATGTWQLKDRNTEIEFNVPAFANENESLGEDLYEIHDDWNIILASETQLHLQDEDERFELQKVIE